MNQTSIPRVPDSGIRILRGLAILGVISHHLANRRFVSEARETLMVIPYLLDWCVFAFLAISGWLFAGIVQAKSYTLWSFLQGRVVRLLVPYLCLTVLYALVWEAVRRSHLISLAGSMPVGVIAKVKESLWPAEGYVVAEQIYFFVLLFLISVGMHCVHKIGGRQTVWAMALLLLIVGLVYFPHAANTGFTPGTAVWGGLVYATAFTMRCHWVRQTWLMVLGVGMILLAVVYGADAVHKLLGLFLLCLLVDRQWSEVPILSKLGDASGTIFAYHTPFLLQPLLIVGAALTGWQLQVLAALTAAALSATILSVLYFLLKPTKIRWVLI